MLSCIETIFHYFHEGILLHKQIMSHPIKQQVLSKEIDYEERKFTAALAAFKLSSSVTIYETNLRLRIFKKAATINSKKRFSELFAMNAFRLQAYFDSRYKPRNFPPK